MTWRAQINDHGVITRYKDLDSGEVISSKEYEKRLQMQQGQYLMPPSLPAPQLTAIPGGSGYVMARPGDGMGAYPNNFAGTPAGTTRMPAPAQPGWAPQGMVAPNATLPQRSMTPNMMPAGSQDYQPAGQSPLIQPGAQMLNEANPQASSFQGVPANPAAGQPPTMGQSIQGKNLRMEGVPSHLNSNSIGYKAHGFLDATSIAILLPTLVLLALIIAAAHKKRLFPWQTLRTFNPPSGLLTPREYERSYLCPPNLRRHGRMGKRDPKASWTEQDGIVIPFGFLARTHLPVTIPLGRLPNKNIFMVAPSGSGKTTLMRAIIKAMLAKPCVIIALEAKANDPNLDEKREGFKYTVLPEAQSAGFKTLYFNPLDTESIHWNPLDLDPITFASSIVQDVNSLPPEEQHWAERDHGYISGLVTLLKWGAVMVAGEDENGQAADIQPLPCNPRGLMRLVNNRRNIVESLRRLKSNPNVDAADLNELTQMLSSIIRTDTDWDKNIQGIRGRLRMFKNPNVLRVTDQSNIDMRASMHEPTVLIFGAPASLGPDAESLASCFVYQLQQALHTRYGTASVLPLFAFFDEYQTLNMDIAGRLSAIVRGANGGLAVILQNISQITGKPAAGDVISSGGSELKTIFSNAAIRICLHNADESTTRFFSEEIGKHAVIIPGISDHYEAQGFGIFPSTWNRIHSQQVVARVDPDAIKRMEKHHGLIYLAPAGDAEFGEVKPMMVDLRGIEEIARLHLLQNVSGRNVPPPGAAFDEARTEAIAAPAIPAGGVPVPPGVFGGTASALAALTAPLPVPSEAAAAPALDRQCPHCGKAAGKGRFCIECGRPIGPSPGQSGSGMTVPGPSGTANGSTPAGSGAPDPYQMPASPGASALPPSRMSPVYPAGMPAADAADATSAASAGLSPADAPAKSPQRLPLTSLNVDLSRFGLPQIPPQAPTHPGASTQAVQIVQPGQPGQTILPTAPPQQPHPGAPRTDTSSSGVEF